MLFKKKKKAQIEEKIEKIQDLEFKNYVLPSQLTFYSSYMYASNGTYTSYVLVKGFPKSFNHYSLFNRVGRLKGVKLSMSFKELPLGVFENLLNTTMTNLSDSVKKRTDVVKYETTTTKQSEFIEKVYNENLKTFSGSILIKIVGHSKEDLQRKRMNVSSALKSVSVLADELPSLQQQAYTSFLPFNSNKVSKYGEFPFSAHTLSNLWLPNYTSFKMPNGYPLGRVVDGGMFCIELFGRKHSNTSNSNFMIIGMSGQGKSYLMKKILLNELMNGVNLVINDMQDEYIDLIENVGGHVFNVPRINVLQIPQKSQELLDEMRQTDIGVAENSFLYHLSFLRNWYKTINRIEVTNKEDKCFEFLCREVYKDFGINVNTHFAIMKNTDYPRLEDVYNKALTLIQGHHPEVLWTKEQIQSVAQSLEPSVLGSDKEYFNCYTETMFLEDEQKIICFRLGDLKNLNDQTRNAIYLNVNNYISSLIFSDKETRWLYLWDEFHMVIDGKPNADNYAVREFATVYNIARKFEVSVGLASTSLNNLALDSIKDYTGQMISQAQFKFIFKTIDSDFNILSKLLSNLNEVEERLIQTQPRFTCLATIDKHKFQFRVDGVDLSNIRGGESEYLLKESLIFGRAGGR